MGQIFLDSIKKDFPVGKSFGFDPKDFLSFQYNYIKMQSIIKLRTQTEPWPKNIISVSDGLKRDIREQENERRTLDLFGRDVSLTPARGLILKKSDKIKIPIGRPLPDDGFSISRDLNKNADLLDALESIGRVTYEGTDPTKFPDIDAPEKLNKIPVAPQFPGYANTSSLTNAIKKARLNNTQTQEAEYPYEPEDPEEDEDYHKYINSNINRLANEKRNRDFYRDYDRRVQQMLRELDREEDEEGHDEIPRSSLSSIDKNELESRRRELARRRFLKESFGRFYENSASRGEIPLPEEDDEEREAFFYDNDEPFEDDEDDVDRDFGNDEDYVLDSDDEYEPDLGEEADDEYAPDDEYEPDSGEETDDDEDEDEDEFVPEPVQKKKKAKKEKAKAEYVPEPVEDSDDEYMPIIEYEPEPRKKQTKTAKKVKQKAEYVPEPIEFLEEERKANKDKKRAKKEKQKAELQPEEAELQPEEAEDNVKRRRQRTKQRETERLEQENFGSWVKRANDALKEIRERQGKQAKQQKDPDFYNNINDALLQQMNEQEEQEERKKEINKQSKRKAKQEEEEEYDYLRREAVNKLNEQGSSSSKEPIMQELEEIRAPELEDKILDPKKSRKELDNYVKKYGVPTPSRNESGNKTKDTIRQDIRKFLSDHRGEKSGNGLRRLRGYGIPNRNIKNGGKPTLDQTSRIYPRGTSRPELKSRANYLTSFGSYLIDQEALYRNMLELYDRSRKVLSQHVSDPIKYVIKDMLAGNYSINEYLTNEEYNQLKKILQFVRLPNPVTHEKRKAGSEKGDLLSLQRRFEILTGEANAGNDSLGGKIIKVVKEMYDRGLINKRLYDEAVRTYRTPIIY